ncbi:MAG TPA: M23 family metallopeptidase [Dermatophilaceae bacterium]|nr:M23 family metallopeptidase [Dermatophilaceae bacterium]
MSFAAGLASAVSGALMAFSLAIGYAAAPAPVPPPVPPTPARPWSWPVTPPPSVVHPFDPPAQPWGSGHRGVDLAAPAGTVVRTPTDGVVTFAGVIAGRAVLVVGHPGGLRSTFEPVHTTVPVGAALARGDPVGVLTETPGHCVPATCLHWGVLRGETYLDPLALLAGRVVLLPV